jgi:two-component system sensor histidine kinase/response regulator
VPIEVALSPLRTVSGTQILAFVIDITDRKRVALELGRYRDHLEELVAERTRQLEEANTAVVARAAEVADLYNNAPCGYHSVDADGNILAMNDTELAWLGYRREEVVGRRRITDLLAPSSSAQFSQRFEAFKAVGEAHDIDYELLRKDGTILPVSVSSTVQRDAAGRIVLIRTTVFDTSERRTRELQIAALNVELERRAGEAEAANRSKSAFLANMSHEIRTPMNAILGFTHMLMRDAREPEARDKLGKIGEAGRHLLAVINDILDLSKIEAGKLTLDHADFAVRQALRHVGDLVAARAQAADVELSLSVDPAVPPIVNGDITRVSQALLNFAGNAVKFTEHGRVEMRVSVDAETADGYMLRFEVEDTGIGIAPEHLPRLFSAFEQADSSTTRRHGGTGLGLAISRRLAELMGGTVGVRSEPGVGSTFWFTVRVAPASAAPVSRTTGDSGAAGEGALTVPQDEGGELRRVSGGARLLLVEDNEVNREVALDLLNEAGLRVDVAEDGAVAVAAARRERYDLILMDMQMPVMDGLAATRAIRQLPEYAEVPILAMTANAFDEDRRQCLEAGMNDHVPKPVDPARLFATLMRWLPHRTLVRPLPVVSGAIGEAASIDAVSRSPQDMQLARLAAVPGLDVTAGLRYSNGKSERYLRLLARYLAGDVGAVSGLAERLAAGDLPEVARRAHSLKGASGFIGATVLQALAAEVQASVDDALPEADVAALTGRLVATHAQLVKDIAVALAGD